MKVLIVGAGGREHALAWRAVQSRQADGVLVAPGNAGTAREAGVRNVPVAADDVAALVELAREEAVGLTIVGPEAPLAAGLVDAFDEAGLACFGPTQAAAALEASKAFGKQFLARHGIPTARYAVFEAVAPALEYVRSLPLPCVIKADGLAAGKGVVIARDRISAEAAVREMLQERRYGPAGQKLVIEEFLRGEEASFIAMVDGEHILPLATSQDHKARDDGDRGPNTGGMGAYSPAPVVTPVLSEAIMERVLRPTVSGMAAEGRPYRGFLYAGLMIGDDAVPRVLEFNCRLGDPETQPMLMRLRSDLLELCQAALAGRLCQVAVDWDPRPALGVVMAAEGYPGGYRKGDVVHGLADADSAARKVFHAGTREHRGEVLTSGGRVLCVTALGASVADAQRSAYEGVARIHWPGAFYRHDIGARAVARERGAAGAR